MNKKNICTKLFAFLMISLLVFAPAIKAQTEAKKLPPVNWIRSRTIDVKHIAVDLKFDWEKEQALGVSTVTVAPFKDTDRIYLDAAYMTINSVKVADGSDLKFNYAGKDADDNLEIILPRVYRRGEDVTVKIGYATNYVNTADADTAIGSFGRGLRFIKPTKREPNKPLQIWSQGETEFNRYWFPSYDSPNDFRTSELRATVDKKYSVISNGKMVEDKDNGDGTHTVYWKMDIPYSNYLTSIVVGEYAEVKNGEYQGIPVYAYGYKNETKEVAATTRNIVDMVKFFSEKTGVKYPYPKYAQTMVEDFGGGMENISATTQIEEMIHDERELLETDSEGLQAHELAHQWFGDYVTTRDWGQIWLNESFATYFDALYQQYKKGHEHFIYDEVRNNQLQVLQTWKDGNRRPIVTKYFANKDAMFDNYAYPGGASILHMLRKHLGDENWWKAINHYLTSNAHQPVSTEDFRIAIEEATGQSMDWFFDQWLYRMGHPVFEVSKSYDAAAKKLTLNVKQTQKLDVTNDFPQTQFFQSVVEVEIDDHIERVWIKPQAENVFTFDAATEPKLVNFDYEGTIFKELDFEKPTDELIYQMLNDKDIIGRRWAMEELSAVAAGDDISEADQTKIAAALRKALESDQSWRIKRAAMDELGSILIQKNQAGIPTGAVKLDDATAAALLNTAKNENALTRGDAIEFLGYTGDAKYASVYLSALEDRSYYVIDRAAVALAKTKDKRAYDAFQKLLKTPSWKGRIQIAGMEGLAELGDRRSLETAFKYAQDSSQPAGVQSAALKIIGAEGKGDPRAYPLIFEAFKTALENNEFQALFDTTTAIIKLADPRGQEAFDMLKTKFKNNGQFMGYITFMETQFKQAVEK